MGKKIQDPISKKAWQVWLPSKHEALSSIPSTVKKKKSEK
jgi:Fe-S cluster biosynthesis and repair protein YggX